MNKKPSIKDIKEALSNSGYVLEHRICPILEESGYHTETNIQYEDIDSGKSCEFDVRASKTEMDNELDVVSVMLLISCKNNHYPVIALTRKVALPTLVVAGRVINCGTPLRIYKNNREYELIEQHFKFNEFHHYHDDSFVATQYCIIITQRNKQSYKAEHGDLYSDIYKLFKVVDSQETFDARFREGTRAEIMKKERFKVDVVPYHVTLIYPVMLFGGDLYEYRLTGRQFNLLKNNRILLYQAISSAKLKGHLYIDMIEEKYLRKYLKIIDREATEIRNRLVAEKELMRENTLIEFKKKHLSWTKPVFVNFHDNI